MAAKPTEKPKPFRTVSYTPQVAPPGRAVLNTLDAEDLELLERLLTEPIEYVDHPRLRGKKADLELFGAKSQLLGATATEFVPPEPVVDPLLPDSKVPTLDAQQEQRLFLRMNLARARVLEILKRHHNKRLTAAAVRQLLAWAKRMLNARAEIARRNIPLVLAMAKRTRLNGIDYNELISEGNMALLRSVEKFNCGLGFKFSTYSCRSILKAFSRVAMRASRHRGRFPVEFDPAIEKSDFLERKREEHENNCIDELRSILVKNLAELNDVERTVIDERFALSAPDPATAQPKTLEQVGLMIGVTKERVRQIQNRALQKIRQVLEESYLAA
jgi:RNA polymerase sigma factor (sigma-70 family)